MAGDTAIEIQVNGESAEISADAAVADVLRDMGIDLSNPKGIAVALNDEVVPKGRWAEVHVSAGDRLEVITARQGG